MDGGAVCAGFGGLAGVSTVVVGTFGVGVAVVMLVDCTVVWTTVVSSAAVRAGRACAAAPDGSTATTEPTITTTPAARTRVCRVPERALITSEASDSRFASRPCEACPTLTQRSNRVNRTTLGFTKGSRVAHELFKHDPGSTSGLG